MLKVDDFGDLYLVPTPIGNLGDITLRALEVLKSVDMIAAEDTRHSGKLLKHFEINKKMLSYHKFNEKEMANKLISILKEGKSIALISDAGTPGISDPAYNIVKKAVSEKINIVSLPGPTAFVPALVASGLKNDRFYFAGFLPDKNKNRIELLSFLKNSKDIIVFYEAPHRLHKFLKDILEFLGDRTIVICRELTKLHETYYRGKISDFIDKDNIVLKGEFVIIVEGCIEKNVSEDEVISMLNKELNSGRSNKEAAKIISEKSGYSRKKIYEMGLKIKNKCN